jgi:hypothetical protein
VSPVVAAAAADVRAAAAAAQAAPAPAPAPAPAATNITAAPPAWLAHDREVLRFSAFLEEAVPGSPAEARRVRRATLLHYLSDGTTQVEAARDATGLPQGTLAARARAPRGGAAAAAAAAPLGTAAPPGNAPPPGGWLGPSDFRLGGAVALGALRLTLADADGFTRAWYQERGAPLGPPAPVPGGDYEARRAAAARPSGLTRADPESPSRFAEALAGRAPSDKRLQRFLAAHGRVLRFWAVWDDPAAPPADTRRRFKVRLCFETQQTGMNQVLKTDLNRRSTAALSSTPHPPSQIHYFLEDDTVEILEPKEGNDGREFHRFVARAPLPLEGGSGSGSGNGALGSGPGGAAAPAACVRPCDLHIGATLRVRGRALLIHDADAFTREWAAAELGLGAAALAPLDVARRAAPPPARILPPHTGIGDEEETAANCARLVPRPPRHDATRALRPGAEAEVLRFGARIVAAGPARAPPPAADRARRFVVSFFLVDATLAVHERAAPGVSGGGKFLERGRPPARPANQGGGRLGAADLFVGARVPLHGRVFELTEADEWTLSWMAAWPGEFPAAAPPPGARAALAAAGGAGLAGGGEAALAAAGAALAAAGVQATPHQALAACRELAAEAAAAAAAAGAGAGACGPAGCCGPARR